jgi:hypothetical protein
MDQEIPEESDQCINFGTDFRVQQLGLLDNYTHFSYRSLKDIFMTEDHMEDFYLHF